MSTEREIVEKFLVAVKTKNIDVLDPHLAEGMTFQILPSSVGMKMEMAEWKLNLINKVFTTVDSFEPEVVKIIEHPLFIVAQLNVTINFPGGNSTDEILLLFNFMKDESGAVKIASITEWVDSLKTKERRAKMASLESHTE